MSDHKRKRDESDVGCSIFDWYSTEEWHKLMLRSTPVSEIFNGLVDFDVADKYTLEMLKSPWNVPLIKSRHAAEGLPRPMMFLPSRSTDLENRWWSDLFEQGIIKESATVLRDRRYIVKSHMIAMFTLDGGNRATLRIDDFYYPTFWLEVSINLQTKRILKIAGRHCEATAFHVRNHPYQSVVWDVIGVTKRPLFRGRISEKNILSIWDEESEYVAFEVVCDISKFVKICNKLKE